MVGDDLGDLGAHDAGADDQHIAWYRLYDSGETLFFSNWDVDKGQPRWMFDLESSGVRALRWDDVAGGRRDESQPYYLSAATAVPFDATHEWGEGDVIPGQVLREPSGSRDEIRVQGEGRWAPFEPSLATQWMFPRTSLD